MESLIADFVQFSCVITEFLLWSGDWAPDHQYAHF